MGWFSQWEGYVKGQTTEVPGAIDNSPLTAYDASLTLGVYWTDTVECRKLDSDNPETKLTWGHQCHGMDLYNSFWMRLRDLEYWIILFYSG
jgi:hypothetical protein